ncbi:MAG: acetyltransferase [Acidimicrobiales bacterium]|jgi:ribosomal protein S18 acetylase RimI-like enzyme|nr:acetyltransferase [Acidimicrobiales bacterium]
MASRISVIEWGRERAKAGPWRGDDRTAYLAPVPDAPTPSAVFLRRCLGTLADRGFTTVITAALAPPEQRPFLTVGFEEHERLHLLARELVDLPEPPPAAMRRGHRGDRPRVLDVDGAAFRPFWRLDDAGLDEAIAATPSARFRVGTDDQREVIGYAVSGRAGRHGYLQRLAVHPDSQGSGLGRALVIDGLRWMERRGAARAVVNTQLDNDAALALYRSLGFRVQPAGLAVLRRQLTGLWS